MGFEVLRKGSKVKHARKHGFLGKMSTKNGRKTIARRRAKGRARLSGQTKFHK